MYAYILTTSALHPTFPVSSALCGSFIAMRFPVGAVTYDRPLLYDTLSITDALYAEELHHY